MGRDGLASRRGNNHQFACRRGQQLVGENQVIVAGPVEQPQPRCSLCWNYRRAPDQSAWSSLRGDASNLGMYLLGEEFSGP